VTKCKLKNTVKDDRSMIVVMICFFDGIVKQEGQYETRKQKRDFCCVFGLWCFSKNLYNSGSSNNSSLNV
jgi:hypothetical protein